MRELAAERAAKEQVLDLAERERARAEQARLEAEARAEQARLEAEARVARERAAREAAEMAQREAEARAAPVVPPFPPRPQPLASMYRAAGQLAFIKTETFDEAVERLQFIINRRHRLLESSSLRFPVVLGTMGGGKTRLGREVADNVVLFAAEQGVDAVALFLDLFTLQAKLPAEKPFGPRRDELAAALFLAIFPGQPIPPNLSMAIMSARIKEAWGGQVEFVVLHVDEFGADPKLGRRLMTLCTSSLGVSDSVHVIPITTGVQVIDDGLYEEVLKVSTTTPQKIALVRLELSEVSTERPLGEKTALEEAFANALGFDWATYEGCENLRWLYRDCGAHPRIVQDLVDLLFRETWRAVLDGMRTSGKLEEPKAKAIFDALIPVVQNEYPLEKWHSIVRKNVDQPGSHDSKRLSTKPLVRRLLICSSTGRLIDLNKPVLDDTSGVGLEVRSDATYSECQASGLVRIDRKFEGRSPNCTVWNSSSARPRRARAASGHTSRSREPQVEAQRRRRRTTPTKPR